MKTWDSEKNAQKLETYFNTHKPRKNKENICLARPNWNGCDFCDRCAQFSERGRLCWKQDAAHRCVYCTEVLQP